MTLTLLSWEPASARELALLLRTLTSPGSGFVAVTGPDGAALLDAADAGDALAEAGRRWLAGRAFDHGHEVTWRSEGDRHVAVLATEQPAPAAPAGGRPCPWSRHWTPVEPEHLLLWRRHDRRLPRPPRLPGSLAAVDALAIKLVPYRGPDGIAWRRYLTVEEDPRARGQGHPR